ncbi:MAG: carboxylesterase family protein [Bryobacteraceae bacterium]
MLSKKIAAFVPGLRTISLVAFTCRALTATGGAPPVVSVTAGSVQGSFEPSGGATFKGIPFAQPPVRELRWREPQPVVVWKGIRNATRRSASCIQPALGTGRFLQPLARLYGAAYNPGPVECVFSRFPFPGPWNAFKRDFRRADFGEFNTQKLILCELPEKCPRGPERKLLIKH